MQSEGGRGESKESDTQLLDRGEGGVTEMRTALRGAA